jgi:hypothetical protein
LRARSLPKSEVSPPSPVRVATRAEGLRGRAGTFDSLAAPVTLCSTSPAKLPAGFMEGPMPSGRGDAKDKNKKKKSKEQLEKELKRKGVAQPVQPMTFEIVKPKRKEKENW